ncbi:MAG TPA: PadR family transcriptional regulator [Pirellulales bacterium]
MTAPARRRANPLALAVLVLLLERAMHPYEMAATLRARRKEESIKLRYGTLYTVIESLERSGMIRAKRTSRQGNRPERTTYELTPAGDVELRDWMRELLSTPAKEFPKFEAALSLLPSLPPGEVVGLLETRVEFLKQDIEQILAGLQAAKAQKLAPLFAIESEFRLACLQTELSFVGDLKRRIQKDGCGFLKQWNQWHADRAAKSKRKSS